MSSEQTTWVQTSGLLDTSRPVVIPDALLVFPLGLLFSSLFGGNRVRGKIPVPSLQPSLDHLVRAFRSFHHSQRGEANEAATTRQEEDIVHACRSRHLLLSLVGDRGHPPSFVQWCYLPPSIVELPTCSAYNVKACCNFISVFGLLSVGHTHEEPCILEDSDRLCPSFTITLC